MNDTVKLIIEIPKDYYEIIKHNVEHHLTDYRPFEIIGNGIPLDDDLESLRAEVRAYFDGQAYGWEEGRKALIDDVKAEIDKLKPWIYKSEILGILDNIGKESEE